MANERTIFCGGVKEIGVTIRGRSPVRLRLWGPHANVHFVYEDVLKGLYGNVPDPFVDLIDVAVYIYCADQAISRGRPTDCHFGEDWRRRLHFVIPVRQPDLWNQAETKRRLVATLSFLTEDEYDFQFVPPVNIGPTPGYFRLIDGRLADGVHEVVLYSGGLDSLCGAVCEALGERHRVLLVQHRSSPKMVPRQRALFGALVRKAGNRPPVLLPVRINKEKGLTHENTQRSRSFLFASLGAALAAMLDLPRVRFYENGVTSLNLPPSAQVVGARASRTTHPQVLERLSSLFSHLARHPFRVTNGFQWLTKAQVVERLVEAACVDLIGLTSSCADPRRAIRDVPHCGGCSQCIYRRFGVLAAGQGAAERAASYRVDLLAGPRDEGHPRTMLAVYVEMASKISQMTLPQFFSRFGEAGRVLRHVGEAADVVARQVFNLYQRHAQDVMKVVNEGIARNAAAISGRTLPSSCLIRLVCDTRPAGGGPPSLPPASAEPLPEYFFRREGQAWRYRFAGGEPKILLPTRGAAYLQQLLARPGMAIPAHQLAYNVLRKPQLFALGDAGEDLNKDDLAVLRTAYEEKLKELDKARANNDLGLVEAIQTDLNWLAERGEKAKGRGSRPRKASDDVDRVRKAVGNAIRRAVEVIGQSDPRLAEHLKRPRLTCGLKPCYRPDSESVDWVA